MKRKITAELEKFFSSDEKKAFLLKGPRQVGKTYAIEEFISSHYDSEQTIKINFLSQPEARYFLNWIRKPRSLWNRMQSSIE